MGRNQIGNSFVWDRNDKFGLGLQIITEDTRYGDQASPGSLTWGGAYCSEYTIDPKEGVIMLVFTNVSPYAWYGSLSASSGSWLTGRWSRPYSYIVFKAGS